MKNVCIVGYGAVGPVHAAALKNIEGVHLYAVCDINPEKVMLCCKEYGCKSYCDFEEMLSDEHIDVVHICTPHYLHKDMTVKALSKGKAVVLEKPVAINMEEMKELQSFLEMHKAPSLCIMLQNRTNACVVKLKEEIASRDVGKLQGIIANLNWHRDEAYYAQDAWRGKWQTEGGGLLINQAVHIVDLMLHFGGHVKEFKSAIHRWGIDGIEVEDTASAIIHFENGAKGIFHATNCYVTDEAFNLELRFEKARFRYADGLLYEILDGEAVILAKDEKMQVGKSYWGCGHQTVIREFYAALSDESSNQAICSGQKRYPDIKDAYEAMKFVFDIYDKSNLKG